MKLIEIALVVVLFLAAFYSFDWDSWNGILIPALLLCSASTIGLQNPASASQKKLKRAINRFSITLVILLVVKVLLLD